MNKPNNDAAFWSLITIHTLPLSRDSITSFLKSLWSVWMYSLRIPWKAALEKAFFCSSRNIAICPPRNSGCFRSTSVTSYTYSVLSPSFLVLPPLSRTLWNPSSFKSFLVFLVKTPSQSARILVSSLKMFILKDVLVRKSTHYDTGVHLLTLRLGADYLQIKPQS